MWQKRIFFSAAILVVALMGAFPAVGLLAGESSTDTLDLSTPESSILEAYGKLPLLFIENQGQVDEAVMYYVKTSGQAVYFTEENIVFYLIRSDGTAADDTADRLVFSLDFLGADSQPAIEGRGKDSTVVNYFIGNDPENWYANVPTYRELVYRDIYPNIDLRLYGDGGMLRYDFVVNPGATPEAIALAYNGIDSLSIIDGELVIGTAFGDIVQSQPYIYQQIGGEVVEVEGGFRLDSDNTYGFHVAAYNNHYPLIIDPVLLDYSTYLGGEDGDAGFSIAVDSGGYAYVTGYTNSDSPGFQTANAGNNDAFVTKIGAPCDITITSTAGGTVTEPGEGTHTYDKGTVVNLVATPNAGYRFVNWTGDVGTIANVEDATTTITMNDDYSITANFVAVYDLTISSTTGGSVTYPGEGTFNYSKGTVVNLVANSDEGYRFDQWTGDIGTILEGNVDDATTTITMNDDYSITANFEEEPSTPSGPGGCFIATAAHGTPMAEEIQILREFRDEYLLANPVGQALVDLYYRVSPSMAEFITEHPSLKPIVRAGLVPAVAMSTVAVNTTPAEKAAIAGLLMLVSAALAVWATRRRGRGPQYT
jgi:hypothetical protein